MQSGLLAIGSKVLLGFALLGLAMGCTKDEASSDDLASADTAGPGAAASGMDAAATNGSASEGNCALGSTSCNGSCVDTLSNNAHCGACGVACGVPQEQCTNGECTCAADHIDCAGVCVDTSSDSANCGGCGVVCTTPQLCSESSCSDSCGDGLTKCGQSCVDLQTSVANCGSCGAVCDGGMCTAGGCAGDGVADEPPPEESTITCDEGFSECDGSCFDHMTDPEHCGSCYYSCLAETCEAGVCPTVKDCFAPIELTEPAFTDFDDYDEAVAPDDWDFEFNGSATGHAGPFFYDDETGTPEHAMVPDADGSGYAMSTSNPEASEYGGGMGLWMRCVDATAYDGVSLRIRGNTPNDFAFLALPMEETSPPDEEDPDGGGTCEATEQDAAEQESTEQPSDCTPAGLEIPVTDTWTQLLIPWASFGNGTAAGGTPVPVDGHNLTGLAFHISLRYVPADPEDPGGDHIPAAGAYELQVDDVEFIEPGACEDGETLCGVGCVDYQTDRDHCGSCGNACDETRVCEGGECVCPPEHTECGDVCADLNSDPQHCGMCGSPCAGPCESGMCQPSTCTTGMARRNETCAEGDVITVGKYRIFNNWWGSEDATGTQCIWDTCLSGNTVAWGTEFQWGGGSPYQVKSFVAIVLGWHWGWGPPSGLPIQLSENRVVDCGWNYTMNASGTFNVTFDMFTSPDPLGEGDPTEEIMILVRDIDGSEGGLGSLVASTNVEGANWSLYSGTNNVWNVYQFIPESNTESANYNVMAFIDDLIGRGLVSSDKYLLSVEAGSEVFDGSGMLDTSAFYCNVQ